MRRQSTMYYNTAILLLFVCYLDWNVFFYPISYSVLFLQAHSYKFKLLQMQLLMVVITRHKPCSLLAKNCFFVCLKTTISKTTIFLKLKLQFKEVNIKPR